MPETPVLEIERTLGLLPRVQCVLTSAFELKRGGVLVERVVQCANEPPCVAVAVEKGHRIATLIRDSHSFGLCLLDRTQKLLIRKFDGAGGAGRDDGDPFDTLESLRLVTGSPILARAVAAIDCEVMRHFDLEADHEMYVGQVVAARTLAGAVVCVCGHNTAMHEEGPCEANGSAGLNGAHASGVVITAAPATNANVVQR